MSDIVADIRCHLQTMAPHQRARLTAEQLRKAADEIERLREAIRRLADQDATLSVCNGNVIVEMDATLTDAEREAVEAAARIIDAYDEEMDGFPSGASATLRGLLERMGAAHKIEQTATKCAPSDANRGTTKPRNGAEHAGSAARDR